MVWFLLATCNLPRVRVLLPFDFCVICDFSGRTFAGGTFRRRSTHI